MAYKKVSAQELQEWIKRNPGKNYRVGGVVQKAPESPLKALLNTVTRPIRAIPGGIYAAATGKKENPFLTADEETNVTSNPIQFANKNAAGLAAFGIPGGTGVVQGAVRGAGSGALAGYGASEEGEELTGAGTGALTGGVLGGLLGLLAKGKVGGVAKEAKSSKIGDTGYKIRGESIGLNPNKLALSRKATSVQSSTQGTQEIKKFFDNMDELGLNTSTSEAASRSTDEALSRLGQQFQDDILRAADDSVVFTGTDAGSIIERVRSAFKNNPSVQKVPIYKELIGDLSDLGNSFTPSQLNAVREKARGLVNWASSSKSAVSQRAASEVFDVVDDFFKASIPDSSGILDKMRNLYTVRPALQTKAVNSGSIPIGTASTNIRIPTGGVQERVGTGLGKLLQGKTPQMPQSDLLRKIAGMGQRGIPAVSSLVGQGLSGSEQALPTDTAQSQTPQGQPQIDPLAIAQLVLSGKLTATEAKYIQELLGGGPQKKMTQAQANATAALQSLDAMEGILSADSSALLKTYLPFEGFSDNAQILEAAALNVEDVIARMRTGAVINDEEAKRYRKMIPRITDTAETRLYKLSQLRQIFTNISAQNQQTDIGALTELLQLQ